ncbi:hypothetical protein [Dokdonella sp.]|uniref:hypothetical protein n=1 Tax=Dokdonella sp. TaxID=2291710 RepID=UPI0031BEB7A2|nr:hypothetical protein [Dokdonella sp.]
MMAALTYRGVVRETLDAPAAMPSEAEIVATLKAKTGLDGYAVRGERVAYAYSFLANPGTYGTAAARLTWHAGRYELVAPTPERIAEIKAHEERCYKR